MGGSLEASRLGFVVAGRFLLAGRSSAKHARDMHEEVFNFFLGRFLDHIRHNWLGFKTRDVASTKLPATYKRKMKR